MNGEPFDLLTIGMGLFSLALLIWRLTPLFGLLSS